EVVDTAGQHQLSILGPLRNDVSTNRCFWIARSFPERDVRIMQLQSFADEGFWTAAGANDARLLRTNGSVQILWQNSPHHRDTRLKQLPYSVVMCERIFP